MDRQEVFVFDGIHGAVKIQEIDGRFYVFLLKYVKVNRENRKEWIFDDEERECGSYKPYEDKDVTSNPDVLFEDVKRWTPHKVRL